MDSKPIKLTCLLVVLSLAITSVAYAFVYENKTHTIIQTIKNKPNYYVNQFSNVDSFSDIGTHSNFTAMQYGPDSSFDNLTEEGSLGYWGSYSSELLINPGGELGTTTGWTAIGPNAANFMVGSDVPYGTAGPHSGIKAFYWRTYSYSNDWAYQEINLIPWLSEIQAGEAQIKAGGWLVSSEYHVPPYDIARMKIIFYNNQTQEITSDTYDTGELNLQTWTQFGISNYLIPSDAVKVRIWFQTYENTWDGGNADDLTVQVRTYQTSSEIPEWLEGYDKRLKLSITNTVIDDTLLDFPVLICLSKASGINHNDLSFIFNELQSDSNRKKIAVTTSDMITQCYVEIESWSQTEEKAYLWVKVPIISNSSDTELYFYYDIDASENTSYVGDVNSSPAENVWDNSYLAVYHLSQIPTGTNYDSTKNNNDLSSFGSILENALVDGKIGKAVDFDGSNDGMESSNYIAYESFTFEALVKAETWYGWRTLISPGGDTSTFDAYDGRLVFWDGIQRNIGPVLSGSDWKHLVARYNDSAPTTRLRGFVNGVITTQTANPTYGPRIGEVRIAACNASGSYIEFWDGILDEIRISGIARSSAWIKGSFYSEQDQLISFQSEETAFFSLNLEVQWINVDFSEANEVLCIFGGVMGSEALQVDVWTGSSWQNVIASLTAGWNNVTVSAYLVASTFTIRFNGSIETADSIQEIWAIDAVLLHLWS